MNQVYLPCGCVVGVHRCKIARNLWWDATNNPVKIEVANHYREGWTQWSFEAKLQQKREGIG